MGSNHHTIDHSVLLQCNLYCWWGGGGGRQLDSLEDARTETGTGGLVCREYTVYVVQQREKVRLIDAL